MSGLLFFMVGLGLLVVQTAILPCFDAMAGCYDLLLPLVVFLGLRRRLRDSLPVVVMIGLLVDNLSGAPPGYYLTAYLWIWAIISGLIRFLRVASTFLLPLTMAGAVLVENLVLLVIPMLLGGGGRPSPKAAIATVAFQMFWALLTGPLLLAVFALAQHRLRQYQERVQARRAVKDN